MKRFTRVAAVATAGLGLLVGATPAHAHTNAGVLVFTGSATTPATFAPGGFGPAVNGQYTFSGTGTGVSTTNGVGTATVGVVGQYHVGLVNVFGHGAYCGLSGGSNGTGNVVFDANPPFNPIATEVDVADVDWAQSAGSVIVFTGDTYGPDSAGEVTGGLAGVVVAQGGAPCVSTGATNFQVVGAAVATW